MASVTIVVGARNNTDEGFARVRTATRNMTRSLRDNFGASGRASGQSFTQRLLNVVNQGIGSMFQAGQGLGQSLGRGLSQAGSNPYVAAGIATLVAVVAPAIGAALAGAITLAFGGAFVGIGAFLLKDNEKVKDAWGKTLDGLKTKFTDAAKPLIPVLTDAAEMVGKLGDKFAPHFEKAMEAAAPHLTKFLEKMGRGIEKFGKTAFKPMMDAFNGLLDEIDVESFFSSLGDAFKYMADAVLDNKKEIGLLFNIILGTIPVVIRIIGFLARMWGDNVRQVKAIAAAVLVAVGRIKQLTGRTVRFFQRGADTVARRVKTAVEWIAKFKSKTVNIAQRGASGAQRAVQGVINTIRRFAGKRVSVGVRGASAAVAAVQRVINRIRNLVGKRVSIGVNFFKGAGSKLASALGFAHGGIVGRAAEGGPRSNLTMVGEHGPELVDLAPGSRVRSNSDSRRLMSQGGGGGGNKTFIIQIAGKNVAELLWDDMRKEVRVRGGNVQTALGGR